MRLIDADATIKYLREFRCKDCDKRKEMKNGKMRFCYEIGDAPCRACDIGDTIDYFLDKDISPTVDAILVVRCKDCEHCYFASNRVPDEQSYVCGKHGIDVTSDWFCADGERENA
jgi:hypothetical protein